MASEGLFSSGYILDLDQDSLGKFPLAASPKEVMEQGKVDAELSWIIRGRERWVWYDRDNDGRFDLLLQASKAPLDFADKAWSISPGGERSPAPGFVGRKLVRAELFKEAKLGAALNQVAAKIMSTSRGLKREPRSMRAVAAISILKFPV